MGQQVPIPEATLRRVGESAKKAANRNRREGRLATARSLEEGVNRVIELASNAAGPGCFVSIDGHTLSDMAPYYQDGSDSDVPRTFLEQYDVWGN